MRTGKGIPAPWWPLCMRPLDDAAPPDAGLELPVIGERYEALACIGRGGMGVVFEAWDRQLERRVALKLLLAARAGEGALREARLLARMSHPNVVCVHDLGRWDSRGAFAPVYIAMELVDGPDLGTWLRAATRRWTEVLDQVVAAGRGLAAIHRAGLVHGDIKPGNVLVGRDRVRIADFGLAQVRTRTPDEDLVASVRAAAAAIDAELGLELEPSPHPTLQLAEPGGGTLPYMAPECLAGERSPGPRSDQYGLCAMTWELLYGVRPFVGSSPQAVLAAVACEQLERGRRPRGLPRRIETILRKGLCDDPRGRWESVDQLLDALTRARTSARRRTLVTLGAAASVLLLDLPHAQPTTLDSGMPIVHCAGQRAFEDAVGGVERALGQLESVPRDEPERRARLLLELERARRSLNELAESCPSLSADRGSEGPGDQSLASR